MYILIRFSTYKIILALGIHLEIYPRMGPIMVTEDERGRMDQQLAITNLKKEAQSNPIAGDVLKMFAERKRARHVVTLGALEQRMKKEGFSHNRDEYASVLKFLASQGFGHLETDKKGRVKALKEVKMTLQSIGQAAVGKQMSLAALKQRNKFNQLQARTSALSATADIIKPKTGNGTGFPVSITVVVNGKPVNLRVPKEFNEKDIGELVVKLTEDKGDRS